MSLSKEAIKAAIKACREWPAEVSCAENWYSECCPMNFDQMVVPNKTEHG